MQIYLIKNKVTGQHYVGQTIWDFNTRYKAGNWSRLTHNRYLKASATKYGKEAFEVSILEEGQYSREELDRLETHYMKMYESIYPSGFNFKEGGNAGRTYYNHKEYELLDAKGNLHRVVNLSQFCKKQNIPYGAMLNMVSGISKSSHGYALKGAAIEDIIDPNEAWNIENISTKENFAVKRKDAAAFCKQHGISRNAFFRLVAEETHVSRGFKLAKTVLTGTIRAEPIKHKYIEIIHDDGREAFVNNVYDFCRQEKIYPGSLYNLINGKSIIMNGWRLKSTIDPRAELLGRLGLSVRLKHLKTGEIIDVKNVSEFCRQKDLSLVSMHSMIAGGVEQYMYWTVADRDLSRYVFPKQAVYVKFVHNDGRSLEGQNPKELARRVGIMSAQSWTDLVAGRADVRKGWRLKAVRYLNDYYPEVII